MFWYCIKVQQCSRYACWMSHIEAEIRGILGKSTSIIVSLFGAYVFIDIISLSSNTRGAVVAISAHFSSCRFNAFRGNCCFVRIVRILFVCLRKKSNESNLIRLSKICDVAHRAIEAHNGRTCWLLITRTSNQKMLRFGFFLQDYFNTYKLYVLRRWFRCEMSRITSTNANAKLRTCRVSLKYREDSFVNKS